ncbi:MAG: hypothetical protein ACFFD2_16360 [Promethearchaeota archaeon]
MGNQKTKETDIVQHVILLKFGGGGINPISCYPLELPEDALHNIGVKLVSVSVGEDHLSEGVSVIPFPQFKILGLTYTFTVPIESSEKLSDAYFLVLMIKEKNPRFIFQNIDHLTDKLKTSSDFLKKKKKKRLKKHYIPKSKADTEVMELYRYFVDFSQKYLEIKELLQAEREESILAATLLYFHRKAGPIVFTTYPREVDTKEKEKKEIFSKDQAKKLCKELEIATYEGFFTRTYPDMSHVSYYFEIPSEWARGKKEMLLLSYIFRKTPAIDITFALNLKAMEFVEKMKVHPEIYKGFYNIYEVENFSNEEKDKTKKMKKLLERWIKTLYITSLDVFQTSSMKNVYKKSNKEKVG